MNTLRHVSVFVENETARRHATQLLAPNGPVTQHEDVLTGVADDATLESLAALNLTVIQHPKGPLRQVGDNEIEQAPADGGGNFQIRAAARESLDAQRDPTLDTTEVPVGTSRIGVFDIQIDGPLTSERREGLTRLGVNILAFTPPSSYRAFLNPVQYDAAVKLSFVKGIEHHSLAASVHPDVWEIIDGAESDPRLLDDQAPRKTFDAVLHRSQDVEAVTTLLENRADVDVIEAAGSTIRFESPVDRSLLEDVATLPEVDMLAPYQAPSLFLDVVRELVGATSIGSFGNDMIWDGAGELVAIFDSGVDPTHPDLADRIRESVSVDVDSSIDVIGHGTHVAGIIAGTGAASDGYVRGIAPGAELLVFAITAPDGTLQLPVDLGVLLQRAVELGAKIINLSWGTPIDGRYDLGAKSLDEFIRANPEVLVVVAAGNQGVAPGPTGQSTFRTVGTPASAKNALTVGACCTARSDIESFTWGTFRPSTFSTPPTADLPVTGNADIPAPSSSRGPTDFDSIKPDVVAPGTFILAPKSSKSLPNIFWNPPGDTRPQIKGADRYAFLGGTSMAAPVVTGLAAVLRQVLRLKLNVNNPSAALLKAMLVASTTPVPSLRPREVVDAVGHPDFDQGFGRVDLRNLMPDGSSSTGGRGIAVADILNGSADALEAFAPLGGRTKSIRTYSFAVEESAQDPLRIVLTWTDYPAASLQNNLQLELIGPGGSRWVGNQDHRYRRDDITSAANGSPAFDRVNNVEEISIVNPSAGGYTVRILASNTPFPPQGYALCVVGDITSQDLTMVR